MLQSTLGIASEFKIYQGFQNFPNGQFTQLKGVWLILVNVLSLCLGNNLRHETVCRITIIFILVCSEIHDFRNLNLMIFELYLTGCFSVFVTAWLLLFESYYPIELSSMMKIYTSYIAILST